jgi:hypothetical protein
VGHQGVLDTIHLLNLCGSGVDPVDKRTLLYIRQCLLMLGAKQGSQEYVPIIVGLYPPIEIDMERHLDGRLE